MRGDNDNAGVSSGAFTCAYGPTEVVVVEAVNNPRSAYWRMVRLPGVTVQYGHRTVHGAVIGESARTVPFTGAAAL